MHNSLKYFSDFNKSSLFGKMEAFMKAENVTGKSISIEHNGNEVTALLGYVAGNPDHLNFHIVSKLICKADAPANIIQDAINKAADEMGSFICQSCCIESGELSIVFLTA